MPIYDYECQQCGHIFEVIESSDRNKKRQCKTCGNESAIRIISATGCFTGNQDSAWVRSITEVVAKGSDADIHDRRFLASGKTKADLRDWMKAKGYRHLERGEPLKPKPPDMRDMPDKIMRRRNERRRIEIRGR